MHKRTIDTFIHYYTTHRLINTLFISKFYQLKNLRKTVLIRLIIKKNLHWSDYNHNND